MGPRLKSRGMAHCGPVRPCHVALQWGRGLRAAECRGGARGPGVRRVWLQWGRGLRAAECLHSITPGATTTIQLQWGRGLRAAECFP